MTIKNFVENYRFELDGGGSYAPTDSERAMLEDALNCFLAETDLGKRIFDIAQAIYEKNKIKNTEGWVQAHILFDIARQLQ